MANNIMDCITEQYHSLTRSGKKLADYIFAHTEETQYLSITSLAENCKVSEATITRFCRSLGLSGYNAFKLALAQTSQTGEAADSSQFTRESILSGDSVGTISRKVHGSCIASLNETLDILNEDDINRAVDILLDAPHVYCFGQGGSMVIAKEAWARFSTVSPNFIHISDTHMQAIAASLASPKDAILFFSYSGSTKDMLDIFHIANSRQVPIVLITHFPKSEAGIRASVVLQCGYNESPLQSGSIAAKMGQMLLIECLFYCFCNRRPEESAAFRSATAEAIANKLL